jgi:hypothetical protein
MLKAVGTEKARVALNAIHDYTKNQNIPPEELELIQRAISAVEKNLQEDNRGKGRQQIGGTLDCRAKSLLYRVR